MALLPQWICRDRAGRLDSRRSDDWCLAWRPCCLATLRTRLAEGLCRLSRICCGLSLVLGEISCFILLCKHIGTGGGPLLISLAPIALGVVLLVLGGETLLRGAVGLANLLKLTPAVIGLTVVAAGTSVPELAVSGVAAYHGSTDIAVSNVVGSNIFNTLVILGLCAVIRPIAIGGNTIRLEYPVLVLVTLIALVLAQDGEINRLDGMLCLTIYVAFTAYLVNLVRGQVTAAEAQDLREEVEELTPDEKRPKAWLSIAPGGRGSGALGKWRSGHGDGSSRTCSTTWLVGARDRSHHRVSRNWPARSRRITGV